MTAIPCDNKRDEHTNDPNQTSSCSRGTLEEAHRRFTQSVTKGILELMRQRGYSRERATSTLLRELSQGSQLAPLTDDEVFYAMNLYGLGMNDASQALTVSRAVSCIMSETPQGMSSAVEAIDNLASKLSITRLLESSNSSSSSSEPSKEDEPSSLFRILNKNDKNHKRPLPQVCRAAASPLDSHGSPSPPPCWKLPKTTLKTTKSLSHGTPIHSTTKQQQQHHPRKRSATDHNHARPRADSVSDEVNAKVAKKARLEEDASSVTEATVRTKRVLCTTTSSASTDDKDKEPRMDPSEI